MMMKITTATFRKNQTGDGRKSMTALNESQPAM